MEVRGIDRLIQGQIPTTAVQLVANGGGLELINHIVVGPVISRSEAHLESPLKEPERIGIHLPGARRGLGGYTLLLDLLDRRD